MKRRDIEKHIANEAEKIDIPEPREEVKKTSINRVLKRAFNFKSGKAKFLLWFTSLIFVAAGITLFVFLFM